MSEAKQVFLEPRELRDEETETEVVCAPICYPGPSDPTAEQIMRAVESSGAVDFWSDSAEDLYSPEDGKPL